MRALASDLHAVTLAQLAPPDYDALEHELEHQSDHPASVARESDAQVAARRALLPDLERRTRDVCHMLDIAPPSAHAP